MTPPSPRRHAVHWPVICTLTLGLLIVVTAGVGSWRGAGAVAPGGTPSASPTASPLASSTGSPVAGTIAGDTGNKSTAHDAVSSITQRIVRNNPILARVQGPIPGDAVFDPYRILTPDQTKSLSGDAQRLKRSGLPILVYIRISLDNQSQSKAFATTLLQKPGLVESSKGAQDGLVVLVSIPPGAREKGNVVIVHGANALPVNGLDDGAIERIYEDGVLLRLRKGEIFAAVEYAVREFNYVIAYSPYSTPVLSPTAKAVGRWLGMVAPLVALGGIALLVLTWFPAGATWRGPVSTQWRRWLAAWWPATIAGGLSAVLIPLAVYARNRIGIFAATLLIIAILLDVWVTADRAARLRSRRVVSVGSTHPANMTGRHRSAPLRPRRPGGSGGPAA